VKRKIEVLCQPIEYLNDDKGASHIFYIDSGKVRHRLKRLLDQDPQTIILGNPYPVSPCFNTFKQIKKRGFLEGCYKNPPNRGEVC
jgi:hypothetical protein